MMNRLMMSAAAIALIAGTSLASAQGAGQGGAAAQSAPAAAAPSTGASAPSGGATHSGEAGPATKSTQSEPTSPGAAKAPRAAEDTGQKSKGMTSTTDSKAPAKDMKAEGKTETNKTDTNMKAESKTDGNMKADGKSGTTNAETKGTERSQSTTGQAGASAKLSTEQRTKITTVIRDQHVAPITNVNFSISIGTRIPRDVSYHPLPTEVVTVYPEWRGYDYILVRDQILVIDPRSHEIVAILDV